MSKRAGNVVTLEDLVEAVGVDAARYELIRYSVDSTIDIDLDLLVQKSSDNPVYYVQYAHARTAAVERNAIDAGVHLADGVDTGLLNTPADTELLAVLGIPGNRAYCSGILRAAPREPLSGKPCGGLSQLVRPLARGSKGR